MYVYIFLTGLLGNRRYFGLKPEAETKWNETKGYSPVFEVFKMGCNISVGQGTEFIRPDIVESQSQPFFFDSPIITC